ncbi:MAG TPA: peroxiredoxin [Vicinamibacterales bacterium]
MSLKLGDIAPSFQALTTAGEIDFHAWLGDAWGVLFSHPRDFTPVCTTELGLLAALEPEFRRRGVRIIGLSVDSLEAHRKWSKDIEAVTGHVPNFPMIADQDRRVAALYGMLDQQTEDTATVRSVFVIGPDKRIKLVLTYPASTGRNFDELLRAIDSLQLTARHQLATPVNWRQGEDVIIVPAVSDAAARERYPKGWRAPRPYLRYVPAPATPDAG